MQLLQWQLGVVMGEMTGPEMILFNQIAQKRKSDTNSSVLKSWPSHLSVILWKSDYLAKPPYFHLPNRGL